MKIDISSLLAALHRLGFRISESDLHALLDSATEERHEPAELLYKLVSLESRERDARNLARRTQMAKLGSVSPLERFDWNHPDKLDRHLFDRLLTVDFVESGHNVLFRGPAGVGKTTLAKHLGFEALRRGYTVRFATFAQALADLIAQESLPALERRLKHYTSPALLILDEIGYLPCDTRAADLFFNIVTRRHESRSIVITTNLAFKKWGALFSGAACVTALVDRFAQYCHTLDIQGPSWRHSHSLASKRDSSSPPEGNVPPSKGSVK